MANQISKELESFKKNVEPSLSKMETTLSNLEEKLEIVITSEKKSTRYIYKFL
jgi:Skp family chaperone for outer membrane proteins